MKTLSGALLAFALLAAPGGVRAQDLGRDVAAPDAKLVQGVLSNGLRYAILPNAAPRQSVSIRLHVAAGSLVETEAERGAAHFVEHMAFQGSRRFPGTTAEARFAAAGIGAGRDQNAFTDVNGALYVFDIPQAAPAKLDLAFDWLRDAMDALTFEPAAAERERAVVLQELAVRRTGSSDLSESVSRFSAPDLLAARRAPGGDAAGLARIDASVLRAFHDRWYRPERATLVVVGDVDAQSMRTRIVQAFGDWAAVAPPTPDPDPGRIDTARPLAAMAVTTPNFAQGAIQVCKIAPRAPPLAPGVAAWRRDGADAMWLQVLRLRLQRLARQADAPVISASVSRNEVWRRAAFTCLNAAPKPGRWEETLTRLSDEVRRLLAHGIGDGEAARARADMSVAVDTAAAATETRASSSLAQRLLSVSLDGLPFTTPGEAARTFHLAEPRLTAAAASDVFRRSWEGGGGPVLVVLSTTPASTPQVLATWSAAQAAPLPPALPDEAAPAWPYTDFGPPGAVVSRVEMKDPDFTRLLFRNGVRVNFKRTAYLRSRVDVRIGFGAGQQELRPAQQIAAIAAVATLNDAGLRRLDPDGVSRALQGRIWGASVSVGRTAFTLSGGTRPSDLLTEMQVLAAYLTDVSFGAQVERRIPVLADTYDKENRIEPVRAAQIALNAALPQPHAFDPPSREVFAALKSADLEAAFRPALTQAPLEVTVVGDVDEAAVIDAVSRTLGALLPRPAGSRARRDAEVTRYPADAPPPIRVTHAGLRDKAAVWMVWPLHVWTPARQRETRALTLLREVVADAVKREVRERLGATYSPSVGLASDRGGDQGAFSVAVQTTPDQVDKVAEAVRAVARRFVAEGVTSAELEKVRKPLMEETARRTESNGWWLSVLDGSWADPYKLEQQRTWLRDYTGITAAEVSAAARRWLAAAPLVAIATPAPALEAASPPAISPAQPVAPPPNPVPQPVPIAGAPA